MKKIYTSIGDFQKEMAEYVEQSAMRVQKKLGAIWKKSEKKIEKKSSKEKEHIYV